MKGLGPWMCLLTISVKNTQPEVVELAKNSGFHRKDIFNLQKPIPLRVWGRLGPVRVSQILPYDCSILKVKGSGIQEC